MDLSAYQAGLMIGAGASLALDHVLMRAVAFFRRRKHPRCPTCDGHLGDDGRALFPVERLFVCGTCGDTGPDEPSAVASMWCSQIGCPCTATVWYSRENTVAVPLCIGCAAHLAAASSTRAFPALAAKPPSQ